jgi:hypothetical protein
MTSGYARSIESCMGSRVACMHTTTTKREEDRSGEFNGLPKFCDHIAAPLIGLIVFVRRDLLTLGQKKQTVFLPFSPTPSPQ